jgi:hypothetical protein
MSVTSLLHVPATYNTPTYRINANTPGYNGFTTTCFDSHEDPVTHPGEHKKSSAPVFICFEDTLHNNFNMRVNSA